MINCIKKELLERTTFTEESVSSIYFGGGTPSLLNTNMIYEIINCIYKNYKVDTNIELTLECNPDDLFKKKLTELKKTGVNRLSIGVQSFDNKTLRFMNRNHDSKQAIKSIMMSKELGYNNISIDLIYGNPLQSVKSWEKDLSVLFELDVNHFSAYCLTIEKNTVLKDLIKKEKIKPLNEKNILEQYQRLIDLSNQNNFIQYEISNFSKNGFLSKHNTAYWKNKIYLGVGPSAHSYNGKSRQWNVSSNKKYIKKISNNEMYYDIEHLTKKEKYNEYVFTSLRTMWGVNTSKIKKHFGEKTKIHFLNESKKWIIEKKMDQNKDVFFLTEQGKLFADKITSDLFLI